MLIYRDVAFTTAQVMNSLAKANAVPVAVWGRGGFVI